MISSVLGLDIGGANLKAAHSSGVARQHSFPLWKNPAGLSQALAELIQSLPPADALAVAMTGELCDCFETRRQGVLAILKAVEDVAGKALVLVWLMDGRFASLAAARTRPLAAAATNWLALATFAGRLAPRGAALLIDIGSTTADIIPLLQGQPLPRGHSDTERLAHQELIYTGIRRTPLCALLGQDGAAELFATTLDIYLVLGQIAEDESCTDTADGRPATIDRAYGRLARMLCADVETCSEETLDKLARGLYEQQQQILLGAVERVAAALPGAPKSVILAGAGEFLATALLDGSLLLHEVRRISLTENLGPEVSQAACAHALAVLASEQLGHE